MNEGILLGRMGWTPELRFTDGRSPVTNISVGIPTGEANEQGQRKWENFKITVWGTAAESITQHGKKGDMVLVKYNLRSTKKDGSNEPVIELHSNSVRRMQFGENRQPAEAPQD